MATRSAPKRRYTKRITSSRRREHRSVSMSGGVGRAGFRKRSKYRFSAIGSGVVTPRQWATSDEEAEPREAIGMPFIRAKLTISFITRKSDS